MYIADVNLKTYLNYSTRYLDYHSESQSLIRVDRKVFLLDRNAWQLLLEHVETRDRKLHGAGELHRFNRDVEEALSRIQEKYTSIPEDLGRDLKAVQSYIKKHEGFESDLVPLEAQVFQHS